MIVNNCVTDNAKLPLSAAQGKALMDLYTKLNSDSQNMKANFYPFSSNEANFCNGYNRDDGTFYFNNKGASMKITRYLFCDGQGKLIFYIDKDGFHPA